MLLGPLWGPKLCSQPTKVGQGAHHLCNTHSLRPLTPPAYIDLLGIP